MDKRLVVICGTMGSGKTTLAKHLEQAHGMKRYSYDEMPNAFDSKHAWSVYGTMYSRAIADLNNGYSIVLDGLFAFRGRRMEVLRATRSVDCRKVVVCMSTPLDECLRRNALRVGVERVPDDIIEYVYNVADVPTLDEGWDEIITV